MGMTSSELVRAACPVIGDTGWAHFFTPETGARGEELGLDVFGFYFLGRGGVLGDVEWPVVHSAFGYFNPDVVRDVWTADREKVSPRDAGRAYFECCAELAKMPPTGTYQARRWQGGVCAPACASDGQP